MPRTTKSTNAAAAEPAPAPTTASAPAMPKSIFKFKNTKPKTLEVDDAPQQDVGTDTTVTTVGRGPEIKAVVVSIISTKSSKGPFMTVYPYACDVPGAEGSVHGGENGTHKTVQFRGKLGTKDIPWNDREIVDMSTKLHIPLRMSFPKQAGKMVNMEPGTFIVLCNVEGSTYVYENEKTGEVNQTEYINASFIRNDEYATWDNVLRSSAASPIDLPSFVTDDKGKCGDGELITFPVIPENSVMDFIDTEKDFHVATVRSATYQEGPIGPDGTNKDYLLIDFEVVSSVDGRQINVMVSNARIYRGWFAAGFSMNDSNLIANLGGQLLSTSKMLLTGSLKRLNVVEGGDDATALIFPDTVVANLYDVVTTVGRPVTSAFARKHMTKAKPYIHMSLDRKIILLNECAYPNGLQTLFKSGDYDFYAISNIDLSGSSEPENGDMYDQVLESLSTQSTVYAIYAVKKQEHLSVADTKSVDKNNAVKRSAKEDVAEKSKKVKTEQTDSD